MYSIPDLPEQDEKVLAALNDCDASQVELARKITGAIRKVGAEGLRLSAKVIAKTRASSKCRTEEVERMLEIINASDYGEVLSGQTVPVDVEYNARYYENRSERREGVFIRQDFGLAVYLLGVGNHYRVATNGLCNAWDTNPIELSVHTKRVLLEIYDDGDVHAEVFNRHGVELQSCSDMHEFVTGKCLSEGDNG